MERKQKRLKSVREGDVSGSDRSCTAGQERTISCINNKRSQQDKRRRVGPRQSKRDLPCPTAPTTHFIEHSVDVHKHNCSDQASQLLPLQRERHQSLRQISQLRHSLLCVRMILSQAHHNNHLIAPPLLQSQCEQFSRGAIRKGGRGFSGIATLVLCKADSLLGWSPRAL